MAQKKATKKAVKKATKAAASGGTELRDFKAAVQQMKTAGMALAKAAKGNEKLRSKGSLRSAVEKMQDASARVARAIPVDPPTTTVSQ